MNYDLLISNIEMLSKIGGISKTKALVDSGVGKDFTVNIKKGTIPSIDKLIKLANYFNVSIDELIGNETHKEKSVTNAGNELDKEVLEIFNQVPLELREFALAQIKVFVSSRDKLNSDKK